MGTHETNRQRREAWHSAYKPKRVARIKQTEALDKMRGQEVFALFMAQRTGKSKVTLDDFGEMASAGKVHDLLVIAPAGAYRTWETAITDDFGLAHILYTWISDAPKKYKDAAKTFLLHDDLLPRILLMNVEALSTVKAARELCLKFLHQNKNMVVIDECFVTGTKISTLNGFIPIELLSSGDMVCTSDGLSRVKTLLKKQSNVLVRITLSDGQIIRVTPNHPFFTDVGWVCAGNLTGRMLCNEKTLQDLSQMVRSDPSSEKVLRDILCSEMENGSTRNQGKNFYAGTQQKNSSDKNKEWDNGTWQSEPQQREANVLCATTTVEGDSKSQWYDLQSSWRQWSPTNTTSKETTENIRPAMETGISNRIGREAARLSNLLQSRSRLSEQEISNRMRWFWPQQSRTASYRQKEGQQACGVRVESIAVEEYKNPIDVFDIELEGTPHFFADGVLVHNSVCIKNHRALRTKFVTQELASLSDYRRILSGLPTPRSPLDLFSQFWFLDPRILAFKNFDRFRDRYAIVHKVDMGKRWLVPIIRGYKNLDELQAKINPHMIRVRLEECYDLPESTYVVRDVPMTKEQTKVYAELKKYATAELSNGSHVTASQVITQMLRLHQVLCGHVKDEHGVEQTLPERRTEELINLLEDHEGKAVIWCSYDADVRKVSAALAKHFQCAVARFWGGNRDTREQEEQLFKTSPACLYMVATAAAGGRGRTWDMADLVVYYSNSHDLDHRMQSEERAKNVGKLTPIAYVDLICRGTVDERILKALRAKINLASTITGDDWRDWVV